MADDFRKDSYAPLIISISYQQFEGAPLVTFDSINWFISLQFEITNIGAWHGTITLWDWDQQFTDGPLTPGRGGLFFVKWEFDNRPELMTAAPVYKAGIVKVSPKFAFEGTQAVFDVMARPVMVQESVADKTLGPRTFPGKQKVSDIVKTIASVLHWDAVPLHIQDTVGNVGPFTMGGETHVDFIRNVLLPMAASAGNESYVFYFDPETDELHFHGKSYYINQVSAAPALYVVNRDPAGEVESFTPENDAMFAFVLGGGDGSMASVDSNGGTPNETKHTLENGVQPTNNATANPPTANAPTIIKAAEDVTQSHIRPNPAVPAEGSFNGLVARTKAELDAKAAALHDRFKNAAYKATLVVKGTHAVRPAKRMVDARVYTRTAIEGGTTSDTAKALHYLSGLFFANKVTQQLDSSGWKTTMELSRKGLSADAPTSGSYGQDLYAKVNAKSTVTPPPSKASPTD